MLTVGHSMTKAERQRVVAALVAATGDPAHASILGERVASLAAGRLVTTALVDFMSRAQGAGRLARLLCPWCLAVVEVSGLCAACVPLHRAFKVDGAETAAKLWKAMAPTPPAPAVRTEAAEPAPEREPEPAESTPLEEPRPPAILDRFDLSEVMAMCSRKRRYTSQIDADKTARRCIAERGGYLRSYACPACGGWHLTHQRESREVAA